MTYRGIVLADSTLKAMIFILILMEDGLIGTGSNETLAIFSLTSLRSVIGLFAYVQEQPRSLGMKSEKVGSIEPLFSQWTMVLVLWQGCQPVLPAHQS